MNAFVFQEEEKTLAAGHVFLASVIELNLSLQFMWQLTVKKESESEKIFLSCSDHMAPVSVVFVSSLL